MTSPTDQTPVARGRRPYHHVLNEWRGGQVWAIHGATTTIRLMAESHIIRDKTVETSAIHGAIVGDPCVCRVTGTGADDYVIVEVRASRFADYGPADQAASVARGEFSPGVVTPAEGAEWGFYPG